MCVAFVAHQVSTEFPLVLALNRDEYLARPTAPLAWWETPRILAGKDLKGGGTWFAVDAEGSFALVTNFRDPTLFRPDAESRGRIPLDFLSSGRSSAEFCKQLRDTSSRYNPFNFLCGKNAELYWLESRSGLFERLSPGVHGLSNGSLRSKWPKVKRGIEILTEIVKQGADEGAMLELLGSRERALDEDLPDTGIGLDKERLLSPLFIRAPGYGTRSSAILRQRRDGSFTVTEVTYDDAGLPAGTVSVESADVPWGDHSP